MKTILTRINLVRKRRHKKKKRNLKLMIGKTQILMIYLIKSKDQLKFRKLFQKMMTMKIMKKHWLSKKKKLENRKRRVKTKMLVKKKAERKVKKRQKKQKLHLTTNMTTQSNRKRRENRKEKKGLRSRSPNAKREQPRRVINN